MTNEAIQTAVKDLKKKIFEFCNLNTMTDEQLEEKIEEFSEEYLSGQYVTIKEKRPLVLAARETPMSEIHLRNLYELSRLSNVWIVPPMMTFYQKPESIDDMVTHLAAKLLSPFGVEVKEYRRWKEC